MMVPCSAASISGSTHFVDQNAPKRLIFVKFSNSSVVVSRIDRPFTALRRVVNKNFHRTKLSADGLKAGYHLLLHAQIRDVVTCCAIPEVFFDPLAMVWSFSSVRARRATMYPFVTKRRATASPIPGPAPTTAMTGPFSGSATWRLHRR